MRDHPREETPPSSSKRSQRDAVQAEARGGRQPCSACARPKSAAWSVMASHGLRVKARSWDCRYPRYTTSSQMRAEGHEGPDEALETGAWHDGPEHVGRGHSAAPEGQLRRLDEQADQEGPAQVWTIRSRSPPPGPGRTKSVPLARHARHVEEEAPLHEQHRQVHAGDPPALCRHADADSGVFRGATPVAATPTISAIKAPVCQKGAAGSTLRAAPSGPSASMLADSLLSNRARGSVGDAFIEEKPA